jgi:hypothetical protein
METTLLMLHAEEALPATQEIKLPEYLSDPAFYIFLLIVMVLLLTIAALSHALNNMPSKK